MMRRMCCTGMRAGGTLVSSLGWLGALSFVVSVTLASAAMLATDVQAVHSPAANVPGT